MVNREIMTFVSKHKVLSIILVLIVIVIYPFVLFILLNWLPPGSTVSLPFNLGSVGKSPLDLNKLKEENEKLKAKNEEYIKDVENNNKAIESQKSAINKLKEENTKKDNEINNLKGEVGSLKTEKQQISDKLISKESETKNLNHTNKEFQEQIKQLRSRQIQEQIGKLEKEHISQIKLRDEVYDRIDELDKNIAKYETKCIPVEEVITSSSFGQANQHFVIKKQDKESCEKASEFQKRKELLRDKIAIIQKDIERIDREIYTLRNNL